MYDISIKRFSCTELVENYLSVNCSVKLVNRTTTFIQGTGITKHDIYPIARVTLYYRFSNGMYRKFAIDVTLNCCDLLKQATLPFWLQQSWNFIKEHSNITGCPLKKVGTN